MDWSSELGNCHMFIHEYDHYGWWFLFLLQKTEPSSEKPGREGQIDGLFPKRKERAASSKAACSHPPIRISDAEVRFGPGLSGFSWTLNWTYGLVQASVWTLDQTIGSGPVQVQTGSNLWNFSRNLVPIKSVWVIFWKSKHGLRIILFILKPIPDGLDEI